MIKLLLKKGDLVSLQSLSSGIAGEAVFRQRHNVGKTRLKTIFKLRPYNAPNALLGSAVLAKNPQKRALDFMQAINDPQTKAIFANIGGFDSHQLYPFLNLQLIQKHPTALIGYSDITSLHLIFYQTGVQSFYGPTILSGFAENVHLHNYTIKSFKRALFTNKVQKIRGAKKWTSQHLEWTNQAYNQTSRKMQKEAHGWLVNQNDKDLITGYLLGGCLDTLVKVKNEPFFPKIAQWKGAIIFFETSEAKMTPLQFERALEMLADQIAVANGLIIGKPQDEKYFWEYYNILQAKVKKPFFYNLNFGHTAPLLTIPYGGQCTLNFKDKVILIAK